MHSVGLSDKVLKEREIKSVLKKREDYRLSKAKNTGVNLDSEKRVKYVENIVSVLNIMYLKSGQEISDILEKGRKNSGIFLQNVLENRASSIKVSKKEDLCTKFKGSSIVKELNDSGNVENSIMCNDMNESVNTEVTNISNASRCVEDRFKEFKIVYECKDDVDSRARGLAALQRLYSADFDKNWL